jgi:uncharacterized protein DUF6518
MPTRQRIAGQTVMTISYPALVAYVVAVVVGLVFGAGVQYLGTLTAGSILGTWAWNVSGMSAPWLVLPFVVGMTQEHRRRAMALGLAVTLAALVGYFAMTHSPMEGAPIADFPRRVLNMMRTGYNPLWIVGGIVTGPLCGFMGHRWRVARSWISAVLVTSALCFEPLARDAVGMLSPHPFVWWAEIATGTIVAALFASVIATTRQAHETIPPTA